MAALTNNYGRYIDLIGDQNMIKPGKPYEVIRTWKERLFTRPWNPFKKTRTVIPMVPMKHIYQTGNKIIGHPNVIEKIKKSI